MVCQVVIDYRGLRIKEILGDAWVSIQGVHDITQVAVEVDLRLLLGEVPLAIPVDVRYDGEVHRHLCNPFSA